ncbi:MAG: hypothetical protein ACU0BS_11515 [Hasllibacter sp.]
MRAPLPRPARRWLKARFPAAREAAIDWNARTLSALATRRLARVDWRIEGLDALREAAAAGPVLIAIWHEGILLAPAILARLPVPVASIHSPRPIGKVGSAHAARHGLTPIEMRRGDAIAGQKAALRWAHSGGAIAMAADGPSGPPRAAKSAVIEMATATGASLWVAAFRQPAARRAPGWDRTLIPRAGPAVATFAPGPPVPARRAPRDEVERARAALSGALNALS